MSQNRLVHYVSEWSSLLIAGNLNKKDHWTGINNVSEFVPDFMKIRLFSIFGLSSHIMSQMAKLSKNTHFSRFLSTKKRKSTFKQFSKFLHLISHIFGRKKEKKI